ncbi:uncharacterized protein LOC127736148 isoform X2 [Mytilus californianus]|uniref:uncharacterized protein LOC127736148 isoform X2 n=1 Tax=Mytilus californianus TaxID=6549 RepID=UPI0022457ECC|nr:uncharacterized protein LOC127736148 isoform X2 [Mytilus californianus]
MEETFSALFIMNVLTVVHGVCDRNAISDCILALKPLSSSGTLPDAQSVCKLISAFNTCIAPHKAACEGDDIMLGVHSLKTTVFTLCGEKKAEDECSLRKIIECNQLFMRGNVNYLEHYPTEHQLEKICSLMDVFHECIGPLMKCVNIMKEIPQHDQYRKGLKTVREISNFVCGDHYRTGYIKFGKECFESEKYLTGAANCQNQYVEENSTFGVETPHPVNMECKKIHGMFDCAGTVIQRLCSQDAFEFFDWTKIKYIDIVSRKVNCPILGTTQTPDEQHDGRSANAQSSQLNIGYTHAVMTDIWTGCLVLLWFAI